MQSAPEVSGVERLRPLDWRRRARLVAATLAARRARTPLATKIGKAFARVALSRFSAEAIDRFEAIERVRDRVGASKAPLVFDLSDRFPGARIDTTLGDWASRAAIDPTRGRLLFALVDELRPRRCLELGTNVGLSAAYITSALEANDLGRLISIEMVPEATEQARVDHVGLGLRRAEFRTGLFADLMPGALDDLGGCDLAFVDGDHHEEPTMDYFDALASSLANGTGGVVALDNVIGTEEMERAWERVRRHPRTAAAIRFEALGVVAVEGALPHSTT